MKTRTASLMVTNVRGALTIRRPHGPLPWLYLGKQVKSRQRVEQRLGPEHRWDMGDRLHEAAAALRQPYLDFVAEVGRLQPDQVTWWSTTLSWRCWAIADLYLLSCYLRLSQQLIREAERGRGPRLLIIEDPWLLRQLYENCGGASHVYFHRRGWLAREKIWLGIRGALGRARWLFAHGRRAWRLRAVWPRHTRYAAAAPTVAMYSYPQDRCLVGHDGWRDPFLPQLDQFLQGLGYEVMRFSPPHAGGHEQALAARHGYVEPLILYATPGRVWRALSAFWTPRWPRRFVLGGLSVRRLVQREWWQEIGRASLCIYRLYYECFRALLREGHWRYIVYPYENQPWEKLTALCAAERGVVTVGVQHSTMSRYYLPYFLGRGEADWMPLPDIIGAAGPYPLQLLREGGHPGNRLRLCGSIRYAHLRDRSPLGRAPLTDILVVLPDDSFAGKHLLAALGRSFPSGGADEGLRFHLRFHPATTDVSMEDVPFPAREAAPDFEGALQQCGLVLTTGSTVAVEAALVGRAVVRYHPPLLIDMDPAEVYGDAIPVCSDSTLRQVLLDLIAQPHAEWDRLRRLDLTQVFYPVQWDVLGDIFGRAARGARGEAAHAVVA